MSEETFIEWTDHTGGPWLLCTEVSPGCAECYARDLIESRLAPMIRRAYFKAGLADWETRPVWGKTAPRVKTKGFWREAFRFNGKAEKEGRPTTIFPSLIDWLDEMPAGAIDQDGRWIKPALLRAEFLYVVKETRWVNWLLLTKRPEDFDARMGEVADLFGQKESKAYDPEMLNWVQAWRRGDPPANVAVGFSAEDQERFETRVKAAIQIPAAVRFVSAEPLLGPLAMRDWLTPHVGHDMESMVYAIHVVIAGGESGSGARVCRLAWLRSIVTQCQAAGVRVFVKQVGGNLTDEDLDECAKFSGRSMHHPKGGDPDEWTGDLRVRDAWPPMGAGKLRQLQEALAL